MPSAQLGPKFMKENGIKHVMFSTADGALEAAPAVRKYILLLTALYDSCFNPSLTINKCTFLLGKGLQVSFDSEDW